jgi:hypothetical protein
LEVAVPDEATHHAPRGSDCLALELGPGAVEVAKGLSEISGLLEGLSAEAQASVRLILSELVESVAKLDRQRAVPVTLTCGGSTVRGQVEVDTRRWEVPPAVAQAGGDKFGVHLFGVSDYCWGIVAESVWFELTDTEEHTASTNGGRGLGPPANVVPGHRRSDAILSRCMVRFQGPPMTRRARGSLSAANITVVERRRPTAWDGQLLEYLVSIDARDDADAMARVRAALEAHGSFSLVNSSRSGRTPQPSGIG